MVAGDVFRGSACPVAASFDEGDGGDDVGGALESF